MGQKRIRRRARAVQKPPLPAKVTAPPVVGVFRRQRVLEILDGARAAPLVWLSAPAGSGKTTAVRHWLSARRAPFLWCQVDEGDRDVATLFHYLRIAASALSPAARPLPAIRNTADGTSLKVDARRFFEALGERLPPGCVLILDDYQRGGVDPAWHEVIREGLESLPAGFTTFLISRGEPPAAYARSITTGRLQAIGWDSLRLTSAETRGMARLRLGTKTRLSTGLAGRLHELSDGWMAGLVLLLRNPSLDEPELHKLDAVASQHIFDYFASEVFEALDPQTRIFLIKTSVLGTVSEAVARELSGMPNPDRILARLCRQGFFTERRGKGSYRYHTLFRAFLQERGDATYGVAQMTDLRRVAGGLMRKSDQADEAFTLLSEAADWSGVAALALAEAERLIGEGRVQTLARWLESLPSSSRLADPWLTYWHARTLMGRSPGDAVATLDLAHRGFAAANNGEGISLACSAALYAIFIEGASFAAMDVWLHRLTDLKDDQRATCSPEAEAHRVAGMLLGLSQRDPSHPDSAAWANRARELLEEMSDSSLRAHLGGVLLIHEGYGGDPERIGGLLERLRPSLSDQTDPLAEATLVVGRGMQAMVNSQDAQLAAIADMSTHLAWLEAHGVVAWMPQLASVGACSAFALGKAELAQTFIAALARLGPGASRYALGCQAALASWSAALEGDLIQASTLNARSLALWTELGFPWGLAAVSLERVQLLVIEGRRAEAWAALEASRFLIDTVNSGVLRCTWLFIKAELSLDESPESGDAALSACFEFAREHGFINLFWIHPVWQARLCARALERDIEPALASRIIRTLGLKPEGELMTSPAWPWPLRAEVLGGLEVFRDGRSLVSRDQAQRRPLRLLSTIVALGGKNVPIASVCWALWPESEGDAARRAFDTTLHRLRKLLATDDSLVTRAETVGLNPSVWWVDLWALDSALCALDSALMKPADRSMLQQLSDRVFALVAGPFLVRGDPPAELHRTRERMRARFVRTLLAVGRRFEESFDSQSAIHLYQRLIERDPLADVAFQKLNALSTQRIRPQTPARRSSRSATQ